LLRNYNRWIVRQFATYWKKNAPDQSVLDFGAGVGTLSVLFKEMTGQQPLTLEIDRTQRDILHERGFVATETLDELPGSIDFVYSSNVLEHIEDDVAALVSIRKKDEFWWSIGSVRARVQIALDKNG
jgi:2-polyprenyl-3-methyl-5-hydroxy-6-metoxy-1,4-benzoquinol methylase